MWFQHCQPHIINCWKDKDKEKRELSRRKRSSIVYIAHRHGYSVFQYIYLSIFDKDKDKMLKRLNMWYILVKHGVQRIQIWNCDQSTSCPLCPLYVGLLWFFLMHCDQQTYSRSLRCGKNLSGSSWDEIVRGDMDDLEARVHWTKLYLCDTS